MNLKKLLTRSKPLIGLAPMDGLTDYPFRQIQSQIAKPDVIFTEFVSAEGIAHGGVKLYDKLLYTPNHRPIIAQLFGKNPDSFYQTSLILCHLGFDGIDINMGCPAKKVTQHGSGASLIKNPRLASQLIKAVQSAVEDAKINHLPQKIQKVIIRNQKFSSFNPKVKIIPTVSVKTRLGIDQIITQKWLSRLLKHHLDFITLHGRTLKQGFAGQVDWDEIKKAATLTAQTKTKLLGNGDLQSRRQALNFCRRYQTHGALIGRAACGNPWVFKNLSASPRQKFSAMLRHTQIYQQTFPHRRFEPLRQHFLNYTKTHPHAKQLRSSLVTVNSTADLIKLKHEFTSSGHVEFISVSQKDPETSSG